MISNIYNISHIFKFFNLYINSFIINHYFYGAECHNKLYDYYGVLESLNFPDASTHHANCSWIINAPLGNKINLTFSHFDIEQSHDCRFDYVLIMEGDNDTPNTELGRFCGMNLPPKITSMQHQVFVTFITDENVASNGFRLEWAVEGCGGHLIEPVGTFTSPGYPSSYPMNVDCDWLIEIDYAHSIELTLHDVSTHLKKQRSHASVYMHARAI